MRDDQEQIRLSELAEPRVWNPLRHGFRIRFIDDDTLPKPNHFEGDPRVKYSAPRKRLQKPQHQEQQVRRMQVMAWAGGEGNYVTVLQNATDGTFILEKLGDDEVIDAVYKLAEIDLRGLHQPGEEVDIEDHLPVVIEDLVWWIENPSPKVHNSCPIKAAVEQLIHFIQAMSKNYQKGVLENYQNQSSSLHDQYLWQGRSDKYLWKRTFVMAVRAALPISLGDGLTVEGKDVDIAIEHAKQVLMMLPARRVVKLGRRVTKL